MYIETIYLPGVISDHIVHHSKTGSKGNCSPEKESIGEVIGLFLGNPFDENNRGRVLEQGFMMRSLTARLPSFSTRIQQAYYSMG